LQVAAQQQLASAVQGFGDIGQLQEILKAEAGVEGRIQSGAQSISRETDTP
jgi:NaMN:DMB phosphoribosyltransferase